jgi:hypothetical protein
MDKYPKTSFVSSPDTEIERVVHACKVSASGFYSRHGFFIGDKIVSSYAEALVVLPKLDYERIEGFWDQISKLELQFPIVMSETLRSEVGRLLSREAPVSQKVVSNLRKEWEEIVGGIWEEVDKTLIKERRVIAEIEVRVTKYGTVSSYSFLTKRRGQKLIIYLRADGGVAHLAEAILTGILSQFRDDPSFSWSRREAIVDFWLSRRGIAKYLPKYRPTLKRLARIPQKVRKQSSKYAGEIGIPKEKGELVRLKLSLSKREAEVFELLFTYQGEIVSFDTLADSLWGEGEFLTFWAINKLMQRLRRKLIVLGFSDSCLVTKRGRGYILRLDN